MRSYKRYYRKMICIKIIMFFIYIINIFLILEEYIKLTHFIKLYLIYNTSIFFEIFFIYSFVFFVIPRVFFPWIVNLLLFIFINKCFIFFLDILLLKKFLILLKDNLISIL